MLRELGARGGAAVGGGNGVDAEDAAPRKASDEGVGGEGGGVGVSELGEQSAEQGDEAGALGASTKAQKRDRGQLTIQEAVKRMRTQCGEVSVRKE